MRGIESRWRRFVEDVQNGQHRDFQSHREAFDATNTGQGLSLAWWPGERELSRSNLSALISRLGASDYQTLHRWSTENRAEFWAKAIETLGIHFASPPEATLDLTAGVLAPRWLPGARLNIVDSCFLAPSERTAIVSGSEQLAELTSISYGELERRVNRFANGLQDRGFSEHDAIALYMLMTVDCVVAYLGIIRAGCRVVSIADSFSSAELRKRTDIAGGRGLVTVSSYLRGGRRIELYEKVRQAFADAPGSMRSS